MFNFVNKQMNKSPDFSLACYFEAMAFSSAVMAFLLFRDEKLVFAQVMPLCAISGLLVVGGICVFVAFRKVSNDRRCKSKHPIADIITSSITGFILGLFLGIAEYVIFYLL